jgi:hypothetical protein
VIERRGTGGGNFRRCTRDSSRRPDTSSRPSRRRPRGLDQARPCRPGRERARRSRPEHWEALGAEAARVWTPRSGSGPLGGWRKPQAIPVGRLLSAPAGASAAQTRLSFRSSVRRPIGVGIRPGPATGRPAESGPGSPLEPLLGPSPRRASKTRWPPGGARKPFGGRAEKGWSSSGPPSENQAPPLAQGAVEVVGSAGPRRRGRSGRPPRSQAARSAARLPSGRGPARRRPRSPARYRRSAPEEEDAQGSMRRSRSAGARRRCGRAT